MLLNFVQETIPYFELFLLTHTEKERKKERTKERERIHPLQSKLKWIQFDYIPVHVATVTSPMYGLMNSSNKAGWTRTAMAAHCAV